jgi:anti-sigma factor (TIGR02949 family)
MTSCRELQSLLTPYIDGEVTPEQCAEMEAHLAACLPCRRRADAEAAARTIVRRCRDRLREPAPPALHAACRKLARAAASAPEGRLSHAGPVDASTFAASHPRALESSAPPFSDSRTGSSDPSGRSASATRVRWRVWAPVSVAATLALAVVGVLLFGLFSVRSTALAAQLAADHLHCIRLVEGRPSVDRHQMADEWRKRRGWTVPLPASSAPDDIELIALRRCLHAGGEMAHALYRHHGRVVSLYIFPDGGRRPANLEIMGQRAMIWSEGDHSYAVVADGSAADTERLVAFFTRALR